MALDLAKFNSGLANLKSGSTTNNTTNTTTPTTPSIAGNLSSPIKKSSGLSDIIPAAGGVLGSIGGGIVGSFAEPVGGTIAGSIAGGAGGQALGEWLKEVINHQPTQPKEIAKQGAIGGVFGSIPGGEEGGILAKAGTRAVIGGLTGATTQGIEEAGTTDDFTTRLKKMVTAGGVGALTFPAFGGALDIGKSALQFLGQRLPGDLFDSAITKPAETEKALNDTVKGSLVGHDNVDYAQKNGIIPSKTALTTDRINDSLSKAKTKSTEIEDKLQSYLKDSGVTFGLGEKNQVTGESLYDILNGLKTTLQSSVRGNQIFQTLMNKIPQDANFKSGDISLSTINDMKRTLGESYNIPGVPDIYNKLQTLIENTSGVPKEIRDLNQEAGQLIDIKGKLKDWKSKGALPDNLSPNGIKNAITQAGKGMPKSLQAVINTIALGGYMAIGAATKDISQVGLSIGAVFGIRQVLNKIGEAIAENPETKIQFGDMLQGMYQGATNAQDKADIAGMIRQIGLRTPQFIGKLPMAKSKPIKR